LHGWGSSSDSWTLVQKILAKSGYKVIVPDLPGFGKSITPPKAWELKNYSDFVLDLVDKLEIPQLFLLGHSFGGRIAVKFTREHPEKIKALVLCSSAGIRPKPGLQTRIIYLIAKIGNILFSKNPLARFKDKARNSFYIFLRHKDYVKAKGVMKETIKRVSTEDLLPILPQVKTKVLLVWGQKDKMVPLKYAYLFEENLPNSKLEILPKIGHSPHLERPEKLAEIILNFLRE